MTSPSIQSLSQENRIFNPSAQKASKSHIKGMAHYLELYRQSIDNPNDFWAGQAKNFLWYKKWDKVVSYDWENTIETKWFEGAQTNLSANALDRHLPLRKDQTAFIWVGNDTTDEKKITYGDLFEQTNRLAFLLKERGVQKGDRVTIYLPMIPELVVSLLACARIGAVHSVVFAGFSAEALKDRLIDAESTFLITANEGLRGTKKIDLKSACDQAMDECEAAGHAVKTCLVVQRTDQKNKMKEGRDIFWSDSFKNIPHDTFVEPTKMDAEDPLFILYTSGSTGKPKGVLHTTAGYMVYAASTFKYVFDYQPGDIYFCTADIGWVTGHSYIVYGPLCNGATSILFEGVPNHPHPDRFWDIIEKYKVTQFYTAPTALRSLMREGEKWPSSHDLSSLKILGSVGEPINPEAWMWYYENIGKKNCPIVDTWWQTETGGILISPLPFSFPLKPGSATLPFFGVSPQIIKEDGSPAAINEGGLLVIEKPWPGIIRTVYKNHARFKETYFSLYPGLYFTGDGARRDEDGYYWLMGRIDDVLNVSGHRIGTAEVESALVSHPQVAEAAVVGYPHEIKGTGIYAYVSLKTGIQFSEELKKELQNHVRKEIGPIASPDIIHFADQLPKTRSGKIMRRILRKIAEGQKDDFGDTSTLADPSVIQHLLKP